MNGTRFRGQIRSESPDTTGPILAAVHPKPPLRHTHRSVGLDQASGLVRLVGVQLRTGVCSRCASVVVRGWADSGGQRNSKGRICSIGFLNPRRLRGRSLSSAATQSRSSALCAERSLLLGKYCRSRHKTHSALVGGSLPRCMRVAEEDVDISVHRDLVPLAHLRTLIPGQRRAQHLRQGF
jgi:hypothetical protein